VLAQEFPDLELIIVDDDSSDGPYEILSRFSDPRIRLYRNDSNLGLVMNWNQALVRAEGDHVAVLHQDDWYEPGYLSWAFAKFGQHDELGLLAVSACVRQTDGTLKYKRRRRLGLIGPDEYFRLQYCLSDCPAPSQAILSGHILRAVGLYDTRMNYCPEVDLYMRIAKAGGYAFHSELCLVGRTRSEDRFTGRFGMAAVRLQDYSFLAHHYACDSLVTHDLLREVMRELRSRTYRYFYANIRQLKLRTAARLLLLGVSNEFSLGLAIRRCTTVQETGTGL
jgi:glycosyltransferase involved in cell wall biosynthesis